MTLFIRALVKPSARVEHYLFRVRWILWLLVLPIAWFDGGGSPLPAAIVVWLAIVALFNLGLGLLLHLVRSPSPNLPVVTFIFDTVMFGVLPHLTVSNSNLLAFLLIYPALVGAIRFAPQVGLLVAGLLALAVETRSVLPIFDSYNPNGFASTLPIAALLAATALVGYLVQHEKEAAIKQAAAELEDLRRAMAGAKLFYESTDALSITPNYAPVLEAMLEAGVKGLPPSRREDGQSVGIALLFDEKDRQKRLRVIASRHLDRHDKDIWLAGKQGIVGETLQGGNPVVFDVVGQDPELSVFRALARCRSGVCYPLQAGLEQYGVVLLASAAPRRPSTQHLELMRAFTNQAALAFQNAKLYQDLRVEHDKIIRSENELRRKLARDLHDGPTQKVASLVMQLDFIERLLERDPGQVKAELDKTRSLAQTTLKEIRTSLYTIRPLALETQGLSVALEQLCHRLGETDKVAIQIDAGHFGPDLDKNIAATVFAIVEEAINNARKHAPGTLILVRIAQQGNHLVAVVQDRGPGFDLEQVTRSYDQRSSLGLQTMRERARLMNADLRIETEPGLGTRITLTVPLPMAGTNAQTAIEASPQ